MGQFYHVKQEEQGIVEAFEVDADKLRRELAEAQMLNQRLMTALKSLGKLCYHRWGRRCYLQCPGQIVCSTEGLEKLNDFPPAS